MILYDYIASIPGPRFLAIYALWLVLVIVLILFVKWIIANSGNSSKSQLPEQPDPYLIAYLRSKEAPIELALIALLQKGFLQKSKTGKSVRRTKKKIPSGLHPMETALYREVGDGHPAGHKLLSNSKLLEKVESIFHHHRYELESEGYLRPLTGSPNYLRMGGIFLVLGLGMMKLVAAFSSGHYNVSFLIILMSFGVFAAYVSTFKNRLSGKGNAYLKSLRSAYGELGSNDQDMAVMMLAVAVSNVGILGGTTFADLAMDFSGPASSFSSSVSGCSSCSSCSSCGGGCGGCGGCGG